MYSLGCSEPVECYTTLVASTKQEDSKAYIFSTFSSRNTLRSRMMDIVKELSEKIGPRRPTSKKEKRAALFIKEELKRYSHEVEIHPFSSLSSFSWTFGAIYLLSALGGILGLSYTLLGLPISLAGLIFFYLELSGYPILTSLFCKRESQNVVAYLPCTCKEKKKLVLIAHYDSSRASLLFHPKLVGGFRRSFLLMTGAIILIPLLLILFFLSPHPLLKGLLLLSSLYLLGSVLILIHREIFCKDTKGANDNASGVAVLLEAGERIEREGLKETGVYLVATGSEESGTIGIIDYLQANKEELKDAYFINLDNIGTGDLKYTIGEGMLKLYPSAKELIERMEEINHERGYSIQPVKNTFMSTDAIPVMAQGLKAMSLRAEDERGLLPNWHWPSDTWEKVEEENLLLALEVVYALALKIDEE